MAIAITHELLKEWAMLSLNWAGLFVLAMSIGVYLLQHLYCAVFNRTQNLKKRYNAQWALVTGSSTGIGKSIAFKLAGQGLNVVLVALQDKFLDDTFDEIRSAFPNCQFIKVGTNLGQPGYLADVIHATKDIDVQIVFCNAGYVLTGFFHTRPLEQHMTNFECNAISAVQISHHFLSLLVARKLRGCFVYTSSASAVLPSPFSVLYAGSKAFLSMFAASLAPEVKPYGIDVLAVHPSPVASRFYSRSENAKHVIKAMDFFKGFAVSPDALPDTIFASVGRTIWRDIGATALMFRMMSKVLDLNFLFSLIAPYAQYMPDFQAQLKLIKESPARAAAAPSAPRSRSTTPRQRRPSRK